MLDHLGRGHVTRSEPTPRASGSVFFSHPLSPPARALAAERFLRDAHFSLPDFDSRPRPPAPPSLSPLMEPPLSLCSESKLGVQSVHPICTKPFDFEHCWGGGEKRGYPVLQERGERLAKGQETLERGIVDSRGWNRSVSRAAESGYHGHDGEDSKS